MASLQHSVSFNENSLPVEPKVQAEKCRVMLLARASDWSRRFVSEASRLGYDVHHMDSPSLALAMIVEIDPEILVLGDFGGDLSSEEICDALRVPRQVRPVSVLMTAETPLSQAFNPFEMGIDDVIETDFTTGQLVTVLHQQANLISLQRRVLDREHEILDSMPHALFVVDRNLVLWKANTYMAELFQINNPDFRRHMLGKPIAIALAAVLKTDPASVTPQLIAALSEAIKLNKTRFRAKERLNDEDRLLAGEITPLYQSESHFLVDLRDITEDEQAVLMEARRERLATIGNLAVGVAHEIQNPNTFSRVNASNLRTLFQAMRPIVETGLKHSPDIKLGTLTPEKMFSRIDEAVSGVEMASRRIEAVLGTLKSFGRTPTEQNTEADPIKAVREAHLLTTHVAAGKAELRVELPESLPPVNGGVAELSQVFVNLIQNAILAFDLPGEQLRGNGPACVRVYLENETENEIVIAVSDNGPGIEPAHQSKIFRPYFTTRAQGEGTGLGLSISSDILHRYGGDLTVRSQPAAGATFLVTLRKASAKLSTITEEV